MAQAGNEIRRRTRGVSLVELVITLLILAFISLGTMQLYRVGDKTQRDARYYSDAQSKVREAFRRILRTVRHAYIVEMTGTLPTITNFVGARDSTSTQIIVSVPQPNAGNKDYIRFYLSGTTLYAQRQDDSGAGLEIAAGVQAITFTYYLTTLNSSNVLTTTDVTSSAPGTASEVKITLTLTSGTVTTTENAFVSLRNRNIGF